MRGAHDLKPLKDVAAIRAAQQAVAEMAAIQAQTIVREFETQQERLHVRLNAEERAWAEALEGRSFSLSLAHAWSAQVLRTEDSLRAVAGDIEQAEAELDVAKDAWRLALARGEAAEGMLRQAGRRAAARREEAAANEISDRYGSRGRTR